jgi:hypothetical protein
MMHFIRGEFPIMEKEHRNSHLPVEQANIMAKAGIE